MTSALDRAFDRLDDFLAVQASASPTALLAAVECLQESVGVDDAARGRIAARVNAWRFDAQAGPLVLGLVVGLLAGEVDEEGSPPAPRDGDQSVRLRRPPRRA